MYGLLENDKPVSLNTTVESGEEYTARLAQQAIYLWEGLGSHAQEAEHRQGPWSATVLHIYINMFEIT